MNFEVDFPDDLFLEKNFRDLAPQILEEISPILQESTKNALRQSIQHPGESELVDSIVIGKPKMFIDAALISAYPKGYSVESGNYYYKGRRMRTVTNGAKAFWLEYGVAGRQPARPWQDRAVNSQSDRITNAMQDKYNELMGAE